MQIWYFHVEHQGIMIAIRLVSSSEFVAGNKNSKTVNTAAEANAW